jgi:hypothetical protein
MQREGVDLLMALIVQRTSIPFVGGQEQQVSKELVDPPLLLRAHNVVPVRNGGLQKRPAWVADEFTTQGYPYLPQPERLAKRGDEVLWLGEVKSNYISEHQPPNVISLAHGEATELYEPPICVAKGEVPRFNTRKVLEIVHANLGQRIWAWDCAFAGSHDAAVGSQPSPNASGVVCVAWATINESNEDSRVEYAVIDVATSSVIARKVLAYDAHSSSFVRVCALFSEFTKQWTFFIFHLDGSESVSSDVRVTSVLAATPWQVDYSEVLVTDVIGFDACTSDPEAGEPRLFYSHVKYGEKIVRTTLCVTTGVALYPYSEAAYTITLYAAPSILFWTLACACDPSGTESACVFGMLEGGCGSTSHNMLVTFSATPSPSHTMNSHNEVSVASSGDATSFSTGGQQVCWAGDRDVSGVLRHDSWWVSWESSGTRDLNMMVFYARAERALVPEVPMASTLALCPFARPFALNGQSYLPVYRGRSSDAVGVEIVAPYRYGADGGDPVTLYRVAGRISKGDIAFNDWGTATVNLSKGKGSTVESLYARGRFFTAVPIVSVENSEHRVALFEVSVSDPQRFDWAEAFGCTYFASSIPFSYDGGSCHELGFPCRPQSTAGEITVSIASSPSGGLANGNYYVKAIWEGTDMMGRVSRSDPSSSEMIEITESLKTIAVTFVNLCITTHSNVKLVVFVSNDGGYTFVRSEQIITNNWLLGSETTVALQPQRMFQSYMQTIYTDRMLPSTTPIPAQLVCEWGRRLWLVNGRDVSPSHEIIDGEEPAFSDELRFLLPEPATGVAPYDDRMVIWTRFAIYWLSGDGPNDLGVDGSFSTPQRLPTDFGCIDARSIVRTERGICFQSERGIELLDRGFGTSVISGGVSKVLREDGYSEIVASSWDQQTQICRFIARNPTSGEFVVLCWHTQYDWWTTASVPGMARPLYTDQPAGLVRAAGCNWMALGDRTVRNGEPICMLARETGPVNAEYIDRPAYGYSGADNNQWYQSEIETANVKLDGLLGFQRVWRVEVMTSDQTAVTGLSVAYVTDYADTESVPARAWETESDVALAAVNPTHHVFQVHVKEQQSQAIRLKIKDVQVDGVNRNTSPTFFNLVGFSLQWGQQPGSGRRAEGAKK